MEEYVAKPLGIKLTGCAIWGSELGVSISQDREVCLSLKCDSEQNKI